MRLPHIWVEDVTNNETLVDAAKLLCANAYADLYGGKLTALEGYEWFVKSDDTAVRTMMAFGQFKRDMPAEVLGTGAIRLGSQLAGSSKTPLSFMQMFEPEGGWDGNATFSFDASNIMEATRLAYSPRCQGESVIAEQLRIDVFRRLYNAGTLIGIANGCYEHWGILPRPVAFFIEGKCGIKLQQIEDVCLSVAENSALARARELHPRYWQRWGPALYRSSAPTTTCTHPITQTKIPIRPTELHPSRFPKEISP